MSKKEKEQKMQFFYLDDEKKSKKQNKKQTKSKKKPAKQETKKDDNKFSFDKEIIIGVSKKEDEKKKEKEKVKVKKQKPKKKNEKKKKQNKNEQIKNKQVDQKNEVKEKKKVKKPKKKEKIITPKEQEKIEQRKKKWSKILKYVIIAILVLIVIVITMFSPLFNIKEIIVKGNEKVSQNEIISLSQIKTEENIFKFLKSKVSNQIKENAYIDEVNISRNLPSTLVIEVKERKPAYMIEYAGSYVYVDKQGYILELSTEKLQLPILQGQATESSEFTAGKRLAKKDLEKLSIALKIMEIAEKNDMANLITRIDIENINNIKLGFETESKTAYLGDNTNLLDKMIRIKKIIEQEKGKTGEIFVNMDLNKENSIFRERV